MHPKPLQNMIGVDRVNWVGCKWNFYPHQPSNTKSGKPFLIREGG